MKHFTSVIAMLIALSFTTLGFGQKNIQPLSPKKVFSGIIVDQVTGSPIAGASISIQQLRTGTIAQDSGTFHISVRPGNYLVEISSIGYATVIQNLDLTQDAHIRFALTPSAIEQQAVVVTSSAAAISSRRNPQPVSVIRKSALTKTSATNVMDALSQLVPGVSVLSTGPAIGKPFIRGLGYNRVLTVNDGVRQEGQQWGDEHGIEVDDYGIQKIEVLKGPASLMYGSDALAGVINITSQVAAPEGTIQGNIISEYQTNNALRGFYGNVGGTKNGFSFNIYGTYKGAEDYRNKYDGRVFNSKFYNKDYGGMLGYTGTWGSSRLLLSNFDQHIGMVDGGRDETTGQFTKVIDDAGNTAIATTTDFNQIKPLVPYQHIRHFKATLDNQFHVGKNDLDVILGWQHNQRQEFGSPDEYNIPDAYFDLKTFTYSAGFHLPTMNHWKTSFGVSGMQQNNTNKAEERLIPDYNLFDFGVYGITQYTKDKFTFTGGLRFDNRHVNGKAIADEDDPSELHFEAFQRNFSNLTGSAGLSYEASPITTLKLNIARAFRAPNLAELSSNGAHEGTNRYEIGNHNLNSEKSLQIDGGVDINTEHVSLTASLFYNHINNFIFYEKVLNAAGGDSLMYDAESQSNINVYQFAQHDANLYGGEIGIDIHPHPLDWLHFQNNLSYTKAAFTQAIGGTKNIPDIPAAAWQSTLTGTWLPQGKTVRNFFVSLQSNYTFKQNRPFTGFNTETATGDYWLVNATIGTDFYHHGKTLFTLVFSGNNLGDVAYQSHLSRLKYLDINNATGRQGVFAMGRNFTIKLNVPLSWKW